MPNLDKFRQFHYDATVKVSENTRTLAISALAIVWLFKTEKGGAYLIPEALIWPLLLVVIAMSLDFLQYVYRSIVWHCIFRKEEGKLEERKITEQTELYVDTWVNNFAYVFFYSKILCLAAAYVGLLLFFGRNVHISL